MYPSEDIAASDPAAVLPDHTLENIFARIPLPSIGATRCVSKRWRSLTTSPTFLAAYSQRQEQSESWLYVNGYRYQITDGAPSAAEFPTASKVPSYSWGAGGVTYTLAEPSPHQSIRYKLTPLQLHWVETPALTQPCILPIIGAIKNLKDGAHKLLCAGGLRSEAGRLEPLSTVALFDSEANAWEECEDLPGEFQGLATSRAVTAVVSRRKLYLFHIYSGIVASFDVVAKRWSKVTTLRPPGMEYCYLAVRHCEPLLLGVSNENSRFLFRGWTVDCASMERTGESWPIVCHFVSLQASADANKKKHQAVSHTSMVQVSPPLVPWQPVVCKYFVAVAGSFSRRFPRITEAVDNVLEFCKAVT